MEDSLLENTGIFTKDELRKIQKTRKGFEVGMNNVEKEAFEKFIEFEKNILKNIKARSLKKNEGDMKKLLIQKIVKIYETALSHFTEDMKLWLSYIGFLMQVAHPSLISKTLTTMLQYHTDKRLWHLAAKWELDELENVDKALQYLYQGLHFNPKAKSLYMEIFKLELLNNGQPNLENAKKIFQMMIKEFPEEIEMFVTLLKECTEHKDTGTLQSIIVQYLIDTFNDSDIVWHQAAQRELEGHHLTSDGQYEFIPKPDMTNKISNMVNVYQKAVQVLNNETSWENYLNTLMELVYEGKQTDWGGYVKDMFVQACQHAHPIGYMSEKHYVVWLECTAQTNLINVLEKTTSTHPQYLQPWLVYLRYYINEKNPTKIEEIFQKATASLTSNSLPIWRLRIQYCQLQNSSLTEKIFHSGINYCDEVSLGLRPQYIEWLALYRSSKLLKEEYLRLCKVPPFCLELNIKMAELEALKPKPDPAIFDLIQECVKKDDTALTSWKQYLENQINYGPDWRKVVYKKYFVTKDA